MRRLWAGVVAIAVIAAVAWWLRRGRAGDAAHGADDGSAPAGGVRRGPSVGAAAPAAARAGGRVTRAAGGDPIANATVALTPARRTGMSRGDETDAAVIVTTGADGTWTADGLGPRRYVATASAAGFLPQAHPAVELVAGERTGDIDFALAAGGSPVHGTVSDIGGGPIAGAQLTFAHASVGRIMRGEVVTFAAVTAADGTYQLSLPDDSWFAYAKQPDYLDGNRRFELAGKPVTVDFALAPGGAIRGHVVTRQGVPVPNAQVSALQHGTRFGPAARFMATTATADATGAFQLKPIASGSFDVSARAPGAASKTPTLVDLGIAEQAGDVRVVVEHAPTLSGVVVDKAGAGVPGVNVAVFSFGGASGADPEPTRAHGEFEIVGLQPGSYMLTAIGEDTTPAIGQSVTVGDDDVRDVKVVVDRGATLRGTVQPATAATVALEVDPTKLSFGTMFDAMKAMMASADTDASGAFEIHHAPHGEFSLVASAPDGRTGKLPITIDGDRAGLVVALEPRGSISGRVIDDKGAPVAGIDIRARAADGPRGSFSVSGMDRHPAQTAADGGFRIVGLEVGTVTLAASDDQGRLRWADAAHKDKAREPIAVEVPTPSEVSGVTLTVESRDGVIRGQVVDAQHQPVADAWITAQLAASPPSDAMVAAFFDSGRPPVLTGADGRFVLDHLRHAAYKLDAQAANGRAHATADHASPGDDVTLVLAQLGSLHGTVTSAGAPVPAYDLDCKGPTMVSQHVAAADGTYTLDRLPPGAYDCHVDSDGGPAAGSATVADQPVELDLTLVGWASVSGTAVDDKGAPLAGLSVIASTASMSRAIGDLVAGNGPKTDATGAFDLVHLGPGKASIALFLPAGGFKTFATREVDLVAGQHLELGTITATPVTGLGSGSGSGSAAPP
jgi:hypothetical protein